MSAPDSIIGLCNPVTLAELTDAPRPAAVRAANGVTGIIDRCV